MVIGVLGVSAGLAVGGLVLLVVLNWALHRNVDTEALRTADAIALLAAEDALPDPLPVAGGQTRVQVVDAAGRVRAASIDADRLVPMVRPERLDPGARQRLTVAGERIGLTGPVRMVAVPAGTDTDPLTVLVARSLADVRQSAHVLRTVLLVSFPLLVAVLAAVAWRVVGATLRPVEALRRGAEEITGRNGGGRLPVPASRDEIHRLAATLNDMLGRLESARARQRAFVADAAHELRSPLTNIRTELEVARRLGDRTDWPAVSADLLTDTERLGRLVDNLLLLARLDEAPPRRATGPVELGGLLTAVAARYPTPPVEVLTPREPLWADGDPDQLHRVLTNLVDNAVRHARTRVVLATEPDGTAYHRVTVTDDGPGIPVVDRERVFGRFTRLDPARDRDAGGAGLGLAIVRELVHRAGGRIELGDADPWPGLRVRLLLPALLEEADPG
ncbi:ATP-binding protein [Micromonospora sp. WMMA1363]|uniref:sensor histidine kinase n=1 Tax=Micromonospora sp. WMMA1363 TaxID=3053985 RepID=UPI00259CE26A|nr:ATP-binding protein [Micromonospora sp. WMMA1363]MDM4718227.1 ATP-binding protein [Micromonospora sp. WMMA1363]